MTTSQITTAATALLVLTGCFEEPVREHIHVYLARDGAVVLTAVQEVAGPSEAGSNPALERRLEEARRDIAEGWDRFSRRFDDLGAAADRATVERVDGLLRRAVHSAVVLDPISVEQFFGSEGLSASLVIEGGVGDLVLVPSGATQATSQQRETVERRLVMWSESVTEYLVAGIALYAYLDEHPNRAVPCFSHIFDSHGPDSDPLSSWEEEAVTELKRTTESVSEALLIDSDEAYSLNELSRLVYDPFPTRLTIVGADEPLQSAGFVRRDFGFERPPVDIWRALERLEGRWLEPDLVTAMVTPAAESEQPHVDPVEFASRPRAFGAPPDAREVAAAIEIELEAEPEYSIRWRVETVDDPEEVDPRSSLDAAEYSIPR